MLRIASPLVWIKNWFLTASHFCKLSVSICVCKMVYFAASQHIDEPRCIARYVAFMRVLQNLYESSISNSSRNNKQFIFAQIYKRWLFLSSTIRACSLYFTAAYRIAIICSVFKNQKWNTLQSATTNLHEKAKSQKYPNSKNSRAGQWSHFLSRSNSSTCYVASCNFLQQHVKAKHVASQLHNKKVCSLFILCLCLLWYILYHTLLP